MEIDDIYLCGIIYTTGIKNYQGGFYVWGVYKRDKTQKKDHIT